MKRLASFLGRPFQEDVLDEIVFVVLRRSVTMKLTSLTM